MFEQNPKLRNIHPTKLRIINEIKEQSKYQSAEELLPQILQINQELTPELKFHERRIRVASRSDGRKHVSGGASEIPDDQIFFPVTKNGCLTRYKNNVRQPFSFYFFSKYYLHTIFTILPGT